jgi:hypothetical protein
MALGFTEPSQPQEAQLIEEVQEESLQEQQQEEEEVLGSNPTSLPQPIEIRNIELTPQGQLVNPPKVIKAVYLTSWSAGSSKRIDYVLQLAKTTGVNAVVIDVKDFSGQVAYDTGVLEVALYNGENIKIRDLKGLLKKFHEQGIYTIARVTIFQDPVLAAARPDLAVQNKEGEGIWRDYKGLGWIDPGSQEAWNYNVAIARDAASHGFDEINFDYIRFPSDGNLKDMKFPFADPEKPKSAVLKEFFAHLQENLPDVAISADLFGLTTVNRDDLGIGQDIEDAYWHFDYVYPMVYPSHYANGFYGFAKPAEYPYEIVKYSMNTAHLRLQALQQAYPDQEFAKLRPWLQDFNLGATYDAIMVQAQIQATKEAMGEAYTGFLLWAPTNVYTQEALKTFEFNKATYDAKHGKQSIQEKEEGEEKTEPVESQLEVSDGAEGEQG